VLSSVPPGVHLAPSTVSASSYGVYASLWIREGVTIGPFCGQRRHVDQIDFSKHNPWMWEVLDTEGSVSHVVDASEPPWRTWLSYVRCARQQDEQNLELVQSGNELFYRTTKPIPPDQELLIWYGSRYLLFFGMLDDANYRRSGHLMAEEVTRPACTVKQMLPVCKLQCTVCRRGFNSKSNLRSHMRIHTLEKPFLCQYCHRSFSQSSTLRNHVRLHTGERPYKCHVCRSAYSQLAGLRAHQKSSRHRKPANAAQRTDRGDKPSYPDTHHADDASP
ncbi:PREDICTED: PR domain zinc finger protein 12-like, partial [Priapulus caudatus]|uniref:PR domain zinc finger protein 12-like n=1 Tax=Priapulus caudatus TaxID=37621 RepID=A0ABM1F4C1_PRICU